MAEFRLYDCGIVSTSRMPPRYDREKLPELITIYATDTLISIVLVA